MGQFPEVVQGEHMSSALSRAGCCFTRGSALHKDYTMNIYGSYSLDLHGSASASVFYLLMLSGIQGCKSYETIVEKPRGYAERVWSPRWPCILLTVMSSKSPGVPLR